MTARAVTDCPFCALATEHPDESTFVIEPLNPVTPGHLLVIPRDHVADASVAPALTREVMGHAAVLAQGVGPCNIITSCGAEATQTVFHLHVHVVPRTAGDGLHLPWTGQR